MAVEDTSVEKDSGTLEIIGDDGSVKRLGKNQVQEMMKRSSELDGEITRLRQEREGLVQFQEDMKAFKTNRASFDRVIGVLHPEVQDAARETIWSQIQSQHNSGPGVDRRTKPSPAPRTMVDNGDEDGDDGSFELTEEQLPPKYRALLAKLESRFGSIDGALEAIDESTSLTREARREQGVQQVEKLLKLHPKLKVRLDANGRRALAEEVYAKAIPLIKSKGFDGAVSKALTDQVALLTSVGAFQEAPQKELSLLDKIRGAVPRTPQKSVTMDQNVRPEVDESKVRGSGYIRDFAERMRSYMSSKED